MHQRRCPSTSRTRAIVDDALAVSIVFRLWRPSKSGVDLFYILEAMFCVKGSNILALNGATERRSYKSPALRLNAATTLGSNARDHRVSKSRTVKLGIDCRTSAHHVQRQLGCGIANSGFSEKHGKLFH